MASAFLCAYVRTPIGRYGGALAHVRPDDLAAIPLRALRDAHPSMDLSAIDDVVLGCANQAGEDNRNVARMALLLAEFPVAVPGQTVNRLCGSGLEAVLAAARAVQSGDADLVIAGGVESMTRAPFVMPKAQTPFGRAATLEDTTLGWRLVNPKMKELHGIDSMPETAENVAEAHGVSRADQDQFALRSQQRAAAAIERGRLAREITPVTVPDGKRGTKNITHDEHPRADTTLEALSRLPTPFRSPGTVTAGNAAGVNDGAAALVIASEAGMKRHGLTPIARIVSGLSVGVEPRLMGIGPVPATQKLLAARKLTVKDLGVIELNEAFAAQSLACLRALGLPDDAPHVNANGGAIALGHPLGMSGARLAGTAALELAERGEKYALCTMCIGVGQGIAVLLERP